MGVAQSKEEGLEPTKEWVKDLIDEIVAEEFASPDLELVWEDEDTDAAQAEAQLEARVKLGAVTLNEMRDSLGLDRFDNVAADRPMVLTATGYVPIEVGMEGLAPAGHVETRSAVQKYSINQPRVPAGDPAGGQWTSEPSSRGLNDSRIVSDATPVNTWIPGAQYAGGIEEGEDENRAAGRPYEEPTTAQSIRLDLARAYWQKSYARVLRIDPSWKPAPSFDNSIESQIKAFTDGAREAEAYLERLSELALPRDRDSGEPLSSPGTKTGNPFIDYTTEKLMDVLGDVMDKIGPRPDLDATGYGTLVHVKFAEAVRAAGLHGIDANDVERTFGIEGDAPYGAKSTIRPDVILRDEDGNIIAIYDVKTGRGLDKIRIIQLRFRTGSDSTIPLVELHRGRGPAWKFQCV